MQDRDLLGRNDSKKIGNFRPMRHEEIAAADRCQDRHHPRSTDTVSVRLDRRSRCRMAGQGIKGAPIRGECLGVETEAQGGRWQRGDVSRP